MATVHSYVRFSTPDQIKGDSLRRQAEAAASWCKKNNHKLSNLAFHDLGKSSYRGNKQAALNRFVQAIDEQQVIPGDILLVEAVDRLSRKGIRQTQDLVNSILNRGVDIAILTPIEKVYRAKDENDIGGAIELAAFAYQAHIYSQILSGRIKDWWTGARKVARDQGKPIPGQVPSWIKKTETGFALNPVAAGTIHHIFDRTIDGIGAGQLCAELNEKFPKLGRTAFNRTFVRQIIRSRAVLGEYQPHALDENGKRKPIGDVIQQYFPAVVDEKTWLAAQAACDNRLIERGATGDYCNLFVGIVHHAIDDCPCHVYTYQQKRADGRKVIFRRLKSYKAICKEPDASTPTVDLVEFEKVVLQNLAEIDLAGIVEKKPTTELASALSDLDRKKKRVDQLTAKLTDDSENLDLLIEPIKKLNAEIKELTERVRQLSTTANQESVVDRFAHLKMLRRLEQTPETRQKLREAIKRIVKQINVLPFKLGDQRKSPVGCVLEILFRADIKRRICVMLGTKQMAMYGATLLHRGKPLPNLNECSRKQLEGWISETMPSWVKLLS